jgi:hypothetical protein
MSFQESKTEKKENGKRTKYQNKKPKNEKNKWRAEKKRETDNDT